MLHVGNIYLHVPVNVVMPNKGVRACHEFLLHCRNAWKFCHCHIGEAIRPASSVDPCSEDSTSKSSNLGHGYLSWLDLFCVATSCTWQPDLGSIPCKLRWQPPGPPLCSGWEVLFPKIWPRHCLVSCRFLLIKETMLKDTLVTGWFTNRLVCQHGVVRWWKISLGENPSSSHISSCRNAGLFFNKRFTYRVSNHAP